ncbi:hypothetical protein ABK040_005488 [Willaertia magna]
MFEYLNNNLYSLFHNEVNGDNDDDNNNLLGAKIGTLLGLFLLSLVIGILPYIVHHLSKIPKLAKLSKFLSIIQTLFLYCNCLAAGGILGSGLCHLLPDSMESFENYFTLMNNGTINDDDSSSLNFRRLTSLPLGDVSDDYPVISKTIVEYPWPMMIAGMISLILLALDRVFTEHSHGSTTKHDHQKQHSAIFTNDKVYEKDNYDVAATEEETPFIINSHHSHHHHHYEEENEREKEMKELEKRKYSSLVKSLLFTFAICIHSVFEAFALGLEKDMASFLSLFIPIIAHKGFESLTTGFIVLKYTLCKSFFQILIIVQVMIYSLSTPLGMGVGMYISSGELNTTYYLTSGIIQSIACGSFLFIAAFEVIPGSLEESKGIIDRAVKISLIIIGFIVMAVLAAFS